MSTAKLILGDVRQVLATMEPDSVDFIMASPPFLALRSYLPADDPMKRFEMGSELTPADFIDGLLDVVEACDRVLAPHGSIAFELGDTYAGSGGAGGDYYPGGLREGQEKFKGSNYRELEDSKFARVIRSDHGGSIPNRHGKIQPGGTGWPLDKSLCMIPEAFRLSLAYGYNILRGPERTACVDDYGNALTQGRNTPKWRVRNVVRWCRPNPPVGALSDKVRPATSDILIACKARDRYFDLDAVRGPYSENAHPRLPKGVDRQQRTSKTSPDGNRDTLDDIHMGGTGAPPLDHWWYDEDTFEQDSWLISTRGYRGSHYAVYPPDLCIKPIKAMCPERVCTKCGLPSRRILGGTTYVNSKTRKDATTLHFSGERRKDGENHWDTTGKGDRAATKIAETVGWTDCGHDSWRPGVVLDPFVGSGTTLAVATGLGRAAIGIDLDARNEALVRERVGMFLAEVEDQR